MGKDLRPPLGSAEFQDGGRPGGFGDRSLGSPARVERGRLRKRGRSSERSQSLVEFSLVLPVVLIIAFGVLEFGMALRSYQALANATREGARFASVGNPAGTFPTNCNGSTNTTAIGRVCVAVQPLKLSDMTSVTVTYPNGQAPGNRIVLTAQYNYRYITPVGAIIHFFSGGALSNTIALSSTTDMRME